MSPVIRISDEIFGRLQKHATPLVDTPASVVEKLLDYYESGEIIQPYNESIKLNPDSPGDLTHTKIINGIFGNEKVLKWNRLVDVAHIYAMKKIGNFSTLKTFSISHISETQRSDKGFRFLPEIGISIQGENANQTWKSSLNLAKRLKVEIEVLFEWRENEKAANPGKKGCLSWKP